MLILGSALAYLGMETALIFAASEIGWEQPITAAVIVVAALSGFVWFKPAVDALTKSKDDQIARLSEDNERLRVQRDKLLDSQTTQVLPAVLQSNALFERIIPLIEKAVQ